MVNIKGLAEKYVDWRTRPEREQAESFKEAGEVIQEGTGVSDDMLLSAKGLKYHGYNDPFK